MTIFRYGIRGAVYLRSRDGQVLYVPHDGIAEWVGGTLTQGDDYVTVNSAYGTQKYKLFDHITVNKQYANSTSVLNGSCHN